MKDEVVDSTFATEYRAENGERFSSAAKSQDEADMVLSLPSLTIVSSHPI
jgi:hypothetical protein